MDLESRVEELEQRLKLIEKVVKTPFTLCSYCNGDGERDVYGGEDRYTCYECKGTGVT